MTQISTVGAGWHFSGQEHPEDPHGFLGALVAVRSLLVSQTQLERYQLIEPIEDSETCSGWRVRWVADRKGPLERTIGSDEVESDATAFAGNRAYKLFYATSSWLTRSRLDWLKLSVLERNKFLVRALGRTQQVTPGTADILGAQNAVDLLEMAQDFAGYDPLSSEGAEEFVHDRVRTRYCRHIGEPMDNAHDVWSWLPFSTRQEWIAAELALIQQERSENPGVYANLVARHSNQSRSSL